MKIRDFTQYLGDKLKRSVGSFCRLLSFPMFQAAGARASECHHRCNHCHSHPAATKTYKNTANIQKVNTKHSNWRGKETRTYPSEALYPESFQQSSLLNSATTEGGVVTASNAGESIKSEFASYKLYYTKKNTLDTMDV